MREECTVCYEMVQEWKCAECLPNAELFYGGSESCSSHTSLRLCEEYCYAIFDACKDIPFDIDHPKGPFYLNEPADITAEKWCGKQISHHPACFEGKLNSKRDEHCKCPDHQCHFSILENKKKATRDEL